MVQMISQLSSSEEIWKRRKKSLVLRTGNGILLRLKSLRKSGAEGELFKVEGIENVVAKIFNSYEIASKKERKIQAIIKLFSTMKARNTYFFNFFSESLTIPRARLYTKEDIFCGFLMNEINIKNCLTLGEFMLSKYRGYSKLTDYGLKIVVLRKLVEIVEKLNSLNIVVGDLNYDNVFICKCPKTNIKVVIIDVDSFQFEWLGEVYRLDGIHPDIVPPEILRGELPSVRSDSFIIGILIFRIIMGGFSPFQYIPDDENDEMIEERILNGRNVFNTGKPPKGLPPFEFLSGLREIVERSFNPEPFQRPSTTEILTTLRTVERNIRICHNCKRYNPPTSKCLFCGSNLNLRFFREKVV